MQEPFKFCSACGAQNNLSAQFCQSCGAQFSAPSATQKPEQSYRSPAFIVRLIVILALIGLVVYWALTSPRDPLPAESIALRPSPTPTSTPDLPPSELLARAKTLLARPYDKSAYDGAMDLLNRIPLAAKEFKESMALKQKVIKAREREEETAGTIARKLGAERMQAGLLSKGMDVTVTVSGQGSRTIRFEYVLWSRPLIYQLVVEQNFLEQIGAQGFRKVIFSDGYNYSWRYTFNEKTGQWK